MNMYRRMSSVGGLVILLVGSGCGGGGESGGSPPGAMPVSAVVASAQTRQVEDDVALVASLVAQERVEISSELSSTIVEIRFREGQPVKEGEVLFVLETERTQARLAQAEANHRLARSNFERNRELVETETISQQEFDQTEAKFYAAEAERVLAREAMEDTTIEAPFSGVAGEHGVDIGSYVVPGHSLTTLVRMDPLEAEFDLPERYLGKAETSLAAAFSSAAFPGELFDGTVTYLAPEVDARTRTLRMKAEIDNGEGRLRPGMFGNLRLVFGSREDAVVIPGAAISFNGNQPVVVVMSEEGVAEFRPIVVGRRFDGEAEILDGLVAGERVVVEGYQKMGPGSVVIIAPESERYGIRPTPVPGV